MLTVSVGLSELLKICRDSDSCSPYVKSTQNPLFISHNLSAVTKPDHQEPQTVHKGHLRQILARLLK